MFIEYLVTIMDDLDHPASIEEWKQNIDAAAFEKLNQDVKITSIRKNDHNDKTEYRPTSIKEILNWLPSFDIMEVTVHRIQNDKKWLLLF